MDCNGILSKYEPKPENLLEILHDIQDASENNFLSDEDVVSISRYIKVPVNMVESTLSFYSMYSRKKRGKYVIRICNSPSCYISGSENLLDYMKEKLEFSDCSTTKDGVFTLEISSCLGMCEKSPAMMVNNEVYGNLTKEKIDEIIADYRRRK